MLLSEEELEAIAGDGSNDDYHFARAIEAAILAKLASAELPKLPEPSEMDGTRWGYTSDDMQSHAIEAHEQGFAAGAAAQLAEKPSGWMCQNRKHANQCCIAMNPQTSNDFTEVTELYARREAK